MKCSEILLRDPFVLPYRGTYDLYGTRSETAFAGEAFGFDVYQSADLIEWSKPKEIFTRPEGFWATMNYWAPEVHMDRELLYTKDGGHGMIFRTFDGPCMLTLHSPNRKKSEHPIFIPIRYENGKLSV